jgi:predicted phage tail protein
MKLLYLGLLLMANRVCAAPFLTCDTNPLNADSSLNVATYVITGLGTNPVTVQATTDSAGGQFLHYDLATLPNGKYTVMAAAVNAFGNSSPESAPLTFTKGAPATPLNLRLSTT